MKSPLILVLVFAAACGGADAPSTLDASADVVRVDVAVDNARDGAAEACADLEGAACPSGANTCGPCPALGVEYACVEGVLRRHDCSPSSVDFPCSCGRQDGICSCASGVYACDGIPRPDVESCLRCGTRCNSTDAGDGE